MQIMSQKQIRNFNNKFVKQTVNKFHMNRNYILSNKENEFNHPKSPIKLKINYQARQTFYERSKSPLREQSLNRRNNLRGNKDIKTPPLTSKHTDYNRMYLDESSVQPVSKLTNENSFSLNNHTKSTPDPSMIKPISLEIKKGEEKRKLQQKAPGYKTDHETSQDLSYSKSRPRQNSKHLQFFAKVGNLQKMNNQISSLLSYVYENKTAPKQDKKNQDNSSYKPRYGQVSQNPKSYQRRLAGLEKPKPAEPLVSTFEVDANESKQRDHSVKRGRNISKYEYSTFEEPSKSPYRMLEENNESKSVERKAPNYVRRDVSPKNCSNSTKNLFDEQVGILKTVKSQNFSESLTPSESAQQLSKITTSNNPDLEFYYDSLKKRDEEIQNFKKKLIGEEPHQQKPYNDQTDQSFSEKYKEPFKRRNQPRSFTRDADTSFTKNDSTPQKDMFITKEQIEIYKDINKMNNQAHYQERTSINRLERLAERRANLEKEFRDQANQIKSPTPKSTVREIKHDVSYTHEDSFSGASRQPSKMDQRKSVQRNGEANITSKIDEQIQKIKNELRDCNKEKSYLRQKYSSILSKQNSNFESKSKNDFHAQDRSFNQPVSQPQRNEMNSKFDSQRMFDSQNNKRLKSPSLKIETQQNYHNELRQKIYSENRPKIQRNELLEIKKSEIYEEKGQYEFQQSKNCEEPLKKQIEYQSEQVTNQAPTIKETAELSLHQQQRYESFGPEVSRQFQKKRPVTPKKQFTIQLHKVEITKPETTKIGTLLAEKIQIDLKLRNQREKFIRSTNQNKWNELKSYLDNRYSISKSIKELQQLIAISPEQHNPFSPTSMSSNKSNNNKFSKTNLSTTQITEEIPLLCSLLAESFQFFESRLANKFCQKQLEKQRFSFKELDLNSKGYLSLEDLICFVNLHSGKFYRNRDIIFFVKLLMLQSNTCADQMNGVESYSSVKGVNEYRLSYEFLWNVLTKKE